MNICLAIYLFLFFCEDEMSFKYKRYISELLACAKQNTQCECLKNKCESRSAKTLVYQQLNRWFVCVISLSFASWKF